MSQLGLEPRAPIPRTARRTAGPGASGLIAVLDDVDDVDVLLLTSHLDSEARRLLFRTSTAVLANSWHGVRKGVRNLYIESRQKVSGTFILTG